MRADPYRGLEISQKEAHTECVNNRRKERCQFGKRIINLQIPRRSSAVAPTFGRLGTADYFFAAALAKLTHATCKVQ